MSRVNYQLGYPIQLAETFTYHGPFTTFIVKKTFQYYKSFQTNNKNVLGFAVYYHTLSYTLCVRRHILFTYCDLQLTLLFFF